MYSSACFNEPTIFKDQNLIQSIFGIQGIFLEKNSSLKLEGKISLSHNIHISGTCSIKNGSALKTGCVIENVNIGTGNNIREYSIIKNSRCGDNNVIGPFCFIRDQTSIENSCIVGSHVEVARSSLSSQVRVSHQAFIGDASIRNNVIIGAGVVFCNFNGESRQQSTIGENVLIGSGSMIISPITIGSNSKVAAGSVVTKNINDDELYLQHR